MRVRLIFVLLLAAALQSNPAEGQEVRRSAVSGTLMSASATIPQMGQAVVFTTPGEGYFILTQFCSPIAGGAGLNPLRGNTFGTIVSMGFCTSYVPGIALPQGEELICTNTAPFAAPCMITGVLSAK